MMMIVQIIMIDSMGYVRLGLIYRNGAQGSHLPEALNHSNQEHHRPRPLLRVHIIPCSESLCCCCHMHPQIL